MDQRRALLLLFKVIQAVYMLDIIYYFTVMQAVYMFRSSYLRL